MELHSLSPKPEMQIYSLHEDIIIKNYDLTSEEATASVISLYSLYRYDDFKKHNLTSEETIKEASVICTEYV